MFKELKESIIFMTEWRGNVREINGNWSKKKRNSRTETQGGHEMSTGKWKIEE